MNQLAHLLEVVLPGIQFKLARQNHTQPTALIMPPLRDRVDHIILFLRPRLMPLLSSRTYLLVAYEPGGRVHVISTRAPSLLLCTLSGMSEMPDGQFSSPAQESEIAGSFQSGYDYSGTSIDRSDHYGVNSG